MNMHESRLEQDGGQKYLVCWYDTERCNWDEIISRALERHKLKSGECPVLCIPGNGLNNGSKTQN